VKKNSLGTVAGVCFLAAHAIAVGCFYYLLAVVPGYADLFAYSERRLSVPTQVVFQISDLVRGGFLLSLFIYLIVFTAGLVLLIVIENKRLLAKFFGGIAVVFFAFFVLSILAMELPKAQLRSSSEAQTAAQIK